MSFISSSIQWSLCRLAELGKGGSTTHRGHKVRVAEPAGTTRGNHDALAVVGEVGDLEERLLGIWVEFAHDGAHGDLEDEVLAVAPVLAGTAAVRAALGLEVVLVAVVDERGEL